MHRPLTVAGSATAAAQIDGRAAPTSLLRPGDGSASDLVALEEPLEIRIAGETVGVLMRTPGDDHRLALGFLFSEGIVQSASEFSAVYHCGRPGDEAYGSAIELAPASDARIDWERIEGTKRGFVSSSACGVCGRRAVEDLVAGFVAPDPIPPIPAALVGEKVAALRDHQPVFAATGGTHVAALWAQDGALIAAHEDVGRHNAVDKVVGALLLARAAAPSGSPGPAAAVLTVSSRAGLEIVQKAARARIPIVATVSAPTSLAIELARASGLTLAGFVRPGRMNVYAGAERLSGL
jgi:FdhD protein